MFETLNKSETRLLFKLIKITFRKETWGFGSFRFTEDLVVEGGEVSISNPSYFPHDKRTRTETSLLLKLGWEWQQGFLSFYPEKCPAITENLTELFNMQIRLASQLR